MKKLTTALLTAFVFASASSSSFAANTAASSPDPAKQKESLFVECADKNWSNLRDKMYLQFTMAAMFQKEAIWANQVLLDIQKSPQYAEACKKGSTLFYVKNTSAALANYMFDKYQTAEKEQDKNYYEAVGKGAAVLNGYLQSVNQATYSLGR